MPIKEIVSNQTVNVKDFVLPDNNESIPFHPDRDISQREKEIFFEDFVNNPTIKSAADLAILFPDEYRKVCAKEKRKDPDFLNRLVTDMSIGEAQTAFIGNLDINALAKIALPNIDFDALKKRGSFFLLDTDLPRPFMRGVLGLGVATAYIYESATYKILHPDFSVDWETVKSNIRLNRMPAISLMALRILFPDNEEISNRLRQNSFWENEKKRLARGIYERTHHLRDLIICAAKEIRITEEGLTLILPEYKPESFPPMPIERSF